MMKKMFVSYYFVARTQGQAGFGNTVMDVSREPGSVEDLAFIEQTLQPMVETILKQPLVAKPTILNWKMLDSGVPQETPI